MTAPQTQPTRHRPQVAGLFYPSDPIECAALTDDCLKAGRASPIPDPKIIIAPHAGFVYSGPIAGTVFRPLAKLASRIRRVVLLGPAHRYALRGIASTSTDYWTTPLGDIPVDAHAVSALASDPAFQINDAAFRREHSLEVHLPFLQQVLGDFSLIPLLVGDVAPGQVSDLLDRLWGGPETLISVSSDLSHFHDYETAKKLDRDTTVKIETLRGSELNGENACGCRAVAGALEQARKRDLRVTAVDVRNSGDTAGDKARVVGYGAYAMEDAETARIGEVDRKTLLDTALRTLAAAVKTGEQPKINVNANLSPSLTAMRATFVTLKIDGILRGCVGALAPQRPLIADVVMSAYKAGFADRRFKPLTQAELQRLTLDVSILSHPRPIEFTDEAGLLANLRPGIDGVILEDGNARGLFLPSVWESLPEPHEFLAHLKHKAGLPPNFWSKTLSARRFTAECFGGGRMPAC